VTDPLASAECGAGALVGVGNGDTAPARLGSDAVTVGCGIVSTPNTGPT